MANKKTTLSALSSAAVMLNTLSAQANAADAAEYSIEYLYTNYKEDAVPDDDVAVGEADRYDIDTHQVKGVIPINENTNVTITGLYETMSGASPWYVIPNSEGDPVQVMSGATIDETRSEVGVDFYQKHDRYETTTSVGYSTENDYEASYFAIAGALFFNDRLSTLNFGLNAGQDHIHPTQDGYNRPDSEAKSRLGGYIGFSHVMTANRLIGVNLGVSSLSGYLSDPYKLVCVSNGGSSCSLQSDNRPDRKQSYSATVKFREYIPNWNGAVHVDLGLFTSDWDTNAISTDLAWYQNLGDSWQLTPSARLYYQTAATFYAPYYQNTRQDGYYSSDYRLSEFTSVSGRLKIRKQWQYLAFNVAAERYHSFGDHPSLVKFTALSFGLSSSF